MVQIEIDFLLVGHGRNPIRKNCVCKGHLISEGLFGVFNFPKTQCQNLMNFYPRIYKVVKSDN